MPLTTGSFFGNSSGAESHTNRSSSARGIDGRGGSSCQLPPGTLSRRENVVVSSGELARMFDSIKELGDAIRRQNRTMEKMAGDLQKSLTDVADLKNDLVAIRDSQETAPTTRKGSAGYYGPIPKAVKVNQTKYFLYVLNALIDRVGSVWFDCLTYIEIGSRLIIPRI